MDGWIDMDRETWQNTGSWTDLWEDRKTDNLMDGKTNRQMDGLTGRWPDQWTER